MTDGTHKLIVIRSGDQVSGVEDLMRKSLRLSKKVQMYYHLFFVSNGRGKKKKKTK